jgi:hypothetical protein
LTSLAVTGNVTTGNVSGTTVSGTTGTFTSVAGTLTTAAQPNVTSVGTLSSLAVTGNVAAGNVSGTTVSGTTGSFTSVAGTLTTAAQPNVTSVGTLTSLAVTGNVAGGNITTAGQVVATGNISGNNAIIANGISSDTVGATTSITTPVVTSVAGLTISTASNGNITFNPDGSGVIILSDETANRMLFTGANQEISTDGNATFDGANLVITGSAKFDNVAIDGADITSNTAELTINSAGADINFRVAGDTVANLFVTDAGSDTVLVNTGTATTGATLKIGGTDSVLVPIGTTAERPAIPASGMVRFNTSLDVLEFYDSGAWSSAAPGFTVIVADEFVGDGSTVAFTLSEISNTVGTMVSINGVVQTPITAYSVSGTTLTFTEAPETTNAIDARIFTTTTQVIVIKIASDDNSSIVETVDSGNIEITGNLIPTANVTYNLGSPGAAWDALYVAGNTIYLGGLQLKEINSTTFGVFTADGTTAADIDVGSIDVSGITQGTSIIGISTVNGNAFITVGGVGNVLVVNQSGVDITGNLAVTGDIVAQNVNSLSDATLKTNITPLTNVGSVINRLNGVEYDWTNGSGHSYGLLAQDVEKVLPSAVKTDGNGLKSVNYQMIIPFLIETIKGLGTQLDELKKIINK